MDFGTDNPWEQVTLMLVGLSVVTAVATVATWRRVLNYLVDKSVLVPAERDPLLELPAGAGIGLDGPRLAMVAAALVLLVAFGITAVRRHLQGERE